MARVIYQLARREFGLHTSSAVFRVVVGLTIILSVVTVDIGLGDYRDRQAQFAAETARIDAARSKRQTVLMGWAVEPLLRALRPPSPASILIRGLDATRADVWDFSPAGVLEGRLSQSGPQDFETGTPIDVEWLMRLMIGFLALWMGVESFGGERVRGHLSAVVVQPVSSATVLAGKTAGASAALAGAIVAVLAAADAVLAARGAGAFWPDRSAFLAAFGAASLEYALAMFGAGALVGGLTKRYATMSAGAIAAWVSLALVGPQLGTGVAVLVAPVEPRARFEQERARIADARENETDRELGVAFFQMDPSGHSAPLASTPEPIRRRLDALWTAGDLKTRAVLSEMTTGYRTAARRRRRLQIALSRLDPAAAFLEAVCNLAGTGRSSVSQWGDDAEAYQRSIEVRLFDNRPRLTVLIPMRGAYHVVAVDRYKPLPTIAGFQTLISSTAPLSQRLRAAAPDLLVLAGYALAFLAGAFFVFLKRRRPTRGYAKSSSTAVGDERPYSFNL